MLSFQLKCNTLIQCCLEAGPASRCWPSLDTALGKRLTPLSYHWTRQWEIRPLMSGAGWDAKMTSYYTNNGASQTGADGSSCVLKTHRLLSRETPSWAIPGHVIAPYTTQGDNGINFKHSPLIRIIWLDMILTEPLAPVLQIRPGERDGVQIN